MKDLVCDVQRVSAGQAWLAQAVLGEKQPEERGGRAPWRSPQDAGSALCPGEGADAGGGGPRTDCELSWGRFLRKPAASLESGLK